jgi:mitochondrial fission protein ELM1
MGTCAGDNNQLLALAHALGFPFEIKKLDFNQARRIPFLRKGLRTVARHSRALIAPSWPDLVIGVGYGSVAVSRYIREQTRGRARLVHIGNPREPLEDFDLQITTPQYPRAAPNLLGLTFPIGNPARTAVVTHDERKWLRDFPRPRRLVAVGGPARHWQLDHRALAGAIRAIQRKSPSGSLIAVTSNRTAKATRRLLERLVGGAGQAVVDHHPAFGTLLSECDEIFVTADSVSMLSEAILTGKPVGMIPIKRSLRGKVSHILWERPTRRRTLPDFRNFWNLLRREKLIGTVEHPIASRASDTVDRAAAAVRSLLSAGDVGATPKGQCVSPHLGSPWSTHRRQ